MHKNMLIFFVFNQTQEEFSNNIITTFKHFVPFVAFLLNKLGQKWGHVKFFKLNTSAP